MTQNTAAPVRFERTAGLGAFVGASIAGAIVLADMVTALVSAFQAVPARANFAVAELSAVALIAISLGAITGGLSGLLVALSTRFLRTQSEAVRLVVTVFLASVPPGLIASASARLLLTHEASFENLVVGLVVGAIASVLFALLSRLATRPGGIELRRWRSPLLVCGAIGLVMGALLGLANGVFTQFDLPGMGLIYIFSSDFFNPSGPLIPTVLGDGALGASLGLIAAWLAVSAAFITERFIRKGPYPVIAFVAVMFVVVGGAGLVGARLGGLFYPSLASILTRDNGMMIIAVGDKYVWPQGALTGIEWGICSAAVGVVVFVGFSRRSWISRWRLILIGILGGAIVAALLGASMWAETWIWSKNISTEEARDVLYPAPLGTSIALGIGALAGLLAVLATDALILRAGCQATPKRSALMAMSVVLLVGGVPLLHLAIYPDREIFLPYYLPLVFNTGIVLLMVGAAGLATRVWARRTGMTDSGQADQVLAVVSDQSADLGRP